jgi:hypothetical protein
MPNKAAKKPAAAAASEDAIDGRGVGEESSAELLSASSEKEEKRKATATASVEGELRTRTAVLLLLLIFVTSLAAMAFVYYSCPDLDP